MYLLADTLLVWTYPKSLWPLFK